MKIRYLGPFFFSFIWSTRSQDSQCLIKALEKERPDIVEKLSCWELEEEDAKIKNFLKYDWRHFFFWSQPNGQSYQSLRDWLLRCPQDYWDVIETYDFIGQYQACWHFIYLQKEDEELLDELLDQGCETRFEEFVQKYFVQVIANIEKDRSINKQMQQCDWLFPLKFLITNKPELLSLLLQQYSDYWLDWFLESDSALIRYWIRWAKQSFYTWLSNHWPIFEKIIAHNEGGIWLWHFVVYAEKDLVHKHRTVIFGLIEKYPNLLKWKSMVEMAKEKHPTLFDDLNLVEHKTQQ